MIDSKDISVIVQGGVNEYTKKSLLSIRSCFPEAEIILSTWTGSIIDGLEYDNVIFSEDPGAIVIDDESGTVNNVNRQIVSTKAGVKMATRKYYLKTRTDIFWTNNIFLNYFGIYDIKYKALHFKNRLLICNYYTRNPRVLPIPFHISDWIIFGLAEDVKLFYSDIDCQKTEEMRWFELNKKKNYGFYTNLLTRYVPEQYICMSFLKKYYMINCDCFYDATKENIELTERIIANDFVVLDYKKDMGILFPKYNPNKYFEQFTLISHKYWKQIYNEYNTDKNKIYKIKKILRNILCCYILRARKIIIKLLDQLGIKEKIKKVLRERSV